RLAALDSAALDIRDGDAVRDAVRRHGPEVIINVAAYNAVDAAEAAPAAARAVNAAGAENLARSAAETGARLVHISTDYVFGDQSPARAAGYTEDDIPAPLNEYGRSKLLGERLVAAV